MSPQLTFFVIALFFGTWMAVLIPPFQSPDEINHFYKSVDLATGHVIVERTDQRLGGTIDKGVVDYAAFFQDRNLRFSDTLRQQSEKIQWRNDCQFTDFANTAFYMPFAYLPQTIGIRIAQLIDNHIFIAFYLARIFNFLLWLALVFQAIQLMPFGKWMIVGLALLPSSLAFHSSCNPDVLVHGIAFLTIAYGLRLAARGTSILTKETIWIVLLTAFLTIQKIIFFPFVLLFYFNKKTFYKVLFISILMLISVYFYNKNTFITYDNYNPEFRVTQTLNEGVNPTLQLQYMLQHPLQFVQIVLVSFVKGAPSTLTHFVGKFGWSAHYLPIWEIVLLLLALFLIAVHEKISLSFSQKISFSILVFGFLSAFSMVMYMLWCPVASPILTNLQGRYFIGVSPFILLIINALYQYFYKKIELKIDIKKSIPTLPLWLMLIWIVANTHLLILIMKFY